MDPVILEDGTDATPLATAIRGPHLSSSFIFFRVLVPFSSGSAPHRPPPSSCCLARARPCRPRRCLLLPGRPRRRSLIRRSRPRCRSLVRPSSAPRRRSLLRSGRPLARPPELRAAPPLAPPPRPATPPLAPPPDAVPPPSLPLLHSRRPFLDRGGAPNRAARRAPTFLDRGRLCGAAPARVCANRSPAPRSRWPERDGAVTGSKWVGMIPAI